MPVYLELICQHRGDGQEKYRCLTDDNNGPRQVAADTKKSVYETAGELFKDAREAGWVLWGSGWVCPNCAAYVESVIRGKSLRLQRQTPSAPPPLLVAGPGLRVMISGPMSGIPDFNRPKFNEAAEQLRCDGHTVYNPATLPDGWSHDQYMTITLGWVENVDALYLLDGWQNSTGAVLEFDRILRNRIPILMFQTLSAFRAAVERSPKLRASLVHWDTCTGGPEYAQR